MTRRGAFHSPTHASETKQLSSALRRNTLSFFFSITETFQVSCLRNVIFVRRFSVFTDRTREHNYVYVYVQKEAICSQWSKGHILPNKLFANSFIFAINVVTKGTINSNFKTWQQNLDETARAEISDLSWGFPV